VRHDPSDIITPHITDSHCLEVPGFPKFWEPHEVALPRWAPIHLGALELDMSPTKHVVMLLLAASLACLILIGAAARRRRHTDQAGHAKGFAGGIESMVLFIRQEVALPNLGHHGEGYAPFILSLFFFILIANLLGLIPYGSTATGNISVTATLALITFVVIELAGIRAQGLGYLKTIIYWNKDLPGWLRFPMFLLMTPIEIVGKLTKPFALMIRLFANMTAGHIVVLALIGTDLRVQELPDRHRAAVHGGGDHDARAVRRVPAGVHLCAAVECVHWTDQRGGALMAQRATVNGDV
jgi:F-type H+-transporting ATPase subunit a